MDYRITFEKEVKTKIPIILKTPNGPDFKPISLSELKLAIKKSNERSTPGLDRISNSMLKNLPHNTLEDILSLFNLSLLESNFPRSWKKACISMIPKKDGMSSDPSNYRPISVTSCLGKILERIMTNRLNLFLEKNSLLVKEQSGFRRHRRTADNLMFLIQKISESFILGKSVCCLFFDISKAFDRVWHDGLIYKLYSLGVPIYLIKWIISFLSLRQFCVVVNGCFSDMFIIRAGVPQGSVISPLLFSVYINDIPKRDRSFMSYSLLFADGVMSNL